MDIHGPPTKSSSINLVTTTDIGQTKRGLDTVPHNTADKPLFATDLSSGPLAGVKFDSWEYEYPVATQVIIKLFEGGLTGTLKATVTFNYTDSTKKCVLNGSVVLP